MSLERSTMMKIVTALLGLLISLTSYGQLVTNTTITPVNLVQNTLLGSGVTAFNIQYTGYSTAIGYFDATNSNVGLDEGLILTTGTASDSIDFGTQVGPYGPNDQSGHGIDNLAPGDNDLAALTNLQSFNAAVLEFDFIPTGDTVRFNYVFGSDEYMEFVGGGVNDAFAFWISGPGFGAPTNIALIPGTTTAVSIDDLNANVNNAYYIDNGDGLSPPQNADPTVHQYDGFTTVLTAIAAVNPCDTFHIKIAISDMGDGVVDSGVFLEANSFTSQNLNVDAEIDFGNNDSTLYEGCGVADLILSRTNNLQGTDTIFFTVTGTATNGVDHTNIPPNLVFQPGQDTITLSLQAFNDGLLEGLESIEIMAISIGACTNDTAFITIYINDVPPLGLTVSADTFTGCGDSVEVWASANGGFGIYTYTWNQGVAPGDTAAWVIPPGTTQYIVTVSDTCNGQSVSDTITVTVPNLTPLVPNAGADTTITCPDLPVTMTGSVTGGIPPYTYSWNTGTTTPSTTETVSTTTTYWITFGDACSQSATDSVTVTLNYTPVQVVGTGDTTICAGDSVTLGAIGSSGQPGYSYLWTTFETTQNIIVTPPYDTWYIVSATDQCNISATDTVWIDVNEVFADFNVTANVFEENFPILFNDASLGSINSWEWDFGNGNTSTDQNTTTTYLNDSTFLVTLIVIDDNGCTDTTTRPVTIFPELQFYAPNAITANGDGLNETFRGYGVGIQLYHMEIYNRWGERIFETDRMWGEWDGTYQGQPVPVGVYIYRFVLRAYAGKEVEVRGHVTVVR